jgi:ABC-type nickel/cobalt efflux system permease component RcnA
MQVRAYNPRTMRRRLARFLLILTALWLPLQAVAGMTMKLCNHAAAAQAQQQDVAEACPYHHGAAPAAPDQAPDKGCDACGVCHLAGVGYIPATAVVAAVLPASAVFLPVPAAARISYIPEPPQQPPKRNA